MTTVICDDNAYFAKSLQERIWQYCARMDIPCQTDIYTSPIQLLEADLSAVQVLFLDVDMPGMNGIDAARRLREKLPDLIIIYVTAWIEYAPYGYQVSAFRYLLKQDLDRDLEPCMDEVMERIHQETESISLPQKDGPLEIYIPHILYLEGASGRKIYLHTVSSEGRAAECAGTLSELEAQLKGKGFLRIQRSFLVNMRHIRQISNYQVLLTNGEALTTSRHTYEQVKDDYTFWKVSRL